ncbi:MlaC/ttg2D family ABC transporter substrate-binding protein [Benzoatithermus flavus]|uniref:ABC transporter substrate-binding protein n=1 Tax=Benzoatithermus flavus TaxID=3108223 RepID=A0ABU8XUC0_9PROT
MSIGRTRRAALAGMSLAGMAIATGLGAGSVEAAPAEAPETFVQSFAANVLTVLRDRARPLEERVHKVDALVSGGVDLDRVARLALGRYWRSAAESERREFAALFKAAMLASYSRRFDAYADRRLRVAGATPAGESDAMVESYLEGGGSPVRLDWRLTPAGGSWRILDVVVEGVSLLVTYRNEFAAVIERGGGKVSALLAELRGRIDAGHLALTG